MPAKMMQRHAVADAALGDLLAQPRFAGGKPLDHTRGDPPLRFPSRSPGGLRTFVGMDSPTIGGSRLDEEVRRWQPDHPIADPREDRPAPFVQLTGGVSAAIGLALLPGDMARAAPRGGYPFTLGVASGDPAPDGVVLWTRLAPDPLEYQTGMPDAAVEVDWEVATDEAMTRVVRSGTALAPPELAHSVHVEVAGLEPGREYCYRFRAGGERSPSAAPGRARAGHARSTGCGSRSPPARTGTTATTRPTATWPRRTSTSSSTSATTSTSTASANGGCRQRAGARRARGETHDARATTASGTRSTRPTRDLQAAHRLFPWVVTWDDHEVENNYAGDRSPRATPTAAASCARRAAAYQAYYEHMPLRRHRMPRGARTLLYRAAPASATSPSSSCSTPGSTAPTSRAATASSRGARPRSTRDDDDRPGAGALAARRPGRRRRRGGTSSPSR